MSVIAAAKKVVGSANEAVNQPSLIAKPLQAANYVLSLPGRAISAVTEPIAQKAAAYWYSGEKYEKTCLTEAYKYADKAIAEATTLVQNQKESSPTVRALHQMGQEVSGLKKGALEMGALSKRIGVRLNGVAHSIRSAVEAIRQRGTEIAQSKSGIDFLIGRVISLMSYIPAAIAYIPSGMGWVFERIGERVQQSIEAMDLRKRLAEEVFLPLILKANHMIGTTVAQTGLNSIANMGLFWGAERLAYKAWTDGISTAKNGLFLANAAVGAWMMIPTIKNGLELASAIQERKKQIEILKGELFRTHPELKQQLSIIPGGADFLIGFFLESNSYLLGYLMSDPESFIQTFCNWTGVVSKAREITQKNQ